VRAGDKLVGHNTDGSGWGWGFRQALPNAKVDRVVLLGAGGAGSAVADAVLRLGAKVLVVVDADAARARALAAHLGAKARAETDIAAALEGADGLIQATPVGMLQHPGMPLDAKLLHRQLWVSEVVYVPIETELLKAARRAGCATMDGGHMNVGQAVRAFKLFTGRDADVARMNAHFRRLAA